MRSKRYQPTTSTPSAWTAPTSSQCSPSAGRSPRSCTPSPSHHYDPAGRTPATGISSTCSYCKPWPERTSHPSQGGLRAHIRRTRPVALATAHHHLPRLERPLRHHGQQPRHADHRARRRHPRVHSRHRHKLNARIYSRSFPRSRHPPISNSDRSSISKVCYLSSEAVASDRLRSAHPAVQRR
jgi:hypothetical protein